MAQPAHQLDGRRRQRQNFLHFKFIILSMWCLRTPQYMLNSLCAADSMVSYAPQCACGAAFAFSCDGLMENWRRDGGHSLFVAPCVLTRWLDAINPRVESRRVTETDDCARLLTQQKRTPKMNLYIVVLVCISADNALNRHATERLCWLPAHVVCRQRLISHV